MRIMMAMTMAMLAMVTMAAEISDTVVRQRWPFSEKVDVDYTLTGLASDVEFTATWAGRSVPYRLGMKLSAMPGRNRFTWDPSTTEFAGQTLADFRVTATPVSSEPRTYLIADIAKGGYTFTNAAPAVGTAYNGWTWSDRNSRLVFRRIPAGVYTNGIDSASLQRLYGSAPPASLASWSNRVVTLNSDCYVAVFQLTAHQYCQITNGTPASANGYYPQWSGVTYATLRGENFTYDTHGFEVGEGSLLAQLRGKIGGDLIIDLCGDEIWEIAARAGTCTLWPNGGVKEDDNDTLKSYINEIAVWRGGGNNALSAVGSKSANAWGFFDMLGNYPEFTLDPSAYRSNSWNTDKLHPMLPSARFEASSTSQLAVRLAVYLNPEVK